MGGWGEGDVGEECDGKASFFEGWVDVGGDFLGVRSRVCGRHVCMH